MLTISEQLYSRNDLELRNLVLDWYKKIGHSFFDERDHRDVWSSVADLGAYDSVIPDADRDTGLHDVGILAAALAELGHLGGFAQVAAVRAALERFDLAVEAGSVSNELGSGAAEVVGLEYQSGTSGMLLSLNGAPTAYFLPAPAAGPLVLERLDPATLPVARTVSMRDLRWRRDVDDVTARIVLSRDATTAAQAYRYARVAFCLLTCAQLVGACRWLIAAAADYSRIRVQFGHPIGAYQGIQHEIAEMVALAEGAEGTTQHALDKLSIEVSPSDPLVAAAVHITAEASWDVLMRCYDVYGGVGFMEETPISMFMREMAPMCTMLGSRAARERAVASTVKRGAWMQ